MLFCVQIGVILRTNAYLKRIGAYQPLISAYQRISAYRAVIRIGNRISAVSVVCNQ